MSAMGGDVNETSQSRGGVQRAEAEAPEGSDRSRWSWARGTSATRVAREGRVRVSTESERESGGATEPG
jgi:hypothetical protein